MLSRVYMNARLTERARLFLVTFLAECALLCVTASFSQRIIISHIIHIVFFHIDHPTKLKAYDNIILQ